MWPASFQILNKRNINEIMRLLEFYSDYSSQEKKDIIEMAHIYFGKLNEEEIEQNFEKKFKGDRYYSSQPELPFQVRAPVWSRV